jgi:hypothetical protein
MKLEECIEKLFKAQIEQCKTCPGINYQCLDYKPVMLKTKDKEYQYRKTYRMAGKAYHA